MERGEGLVVNSLEKQEIVSNLRGFFTVSKTSSLLVSAVQASNSKQNI
jgi:hypothetical protein